MHGEWGHAHMSSDLTVCRVVLNLIPPPEHLHTCSRAMIHLYLLTRAH